MPIITTLYAGLLGLMSIAIAYKAGSTRGKSGISIGHGNNVDLLLAMRRQANFVEYVPLALILIALLEMNGVPKLAIHAMGASLVVFRACHALGLQANTMSGKGRFFGSAGTALLTIIVSVWAIAVFFWPGVNV
jgi:uncharacterized membrane protein YecN with MAPEG domain